MVRTRILYIRYWGSIPCLPTPVGITHRLVSGTIRRPVRVRFPFSVLYWGVGQTVKMSACHAARSGFNSRTSRDYKKYGRAFYNFIEEEMEMNWLIRLRK